MRGYTILAGSGSCFHEQKNIKGTLKLIDNKLTFVSAEFSIVYDDTVYEQLSQKAKQYNKFLNLYVDKNSYKKYLSS